MAQKTISPREARGHFNMAVVSTVLTTAVTGTLIDALSTPGVAANHPVQIAMFSLMGIASFGYLVTEAKKVSRFIDSQQPKP